jgi:hypothetical protein
MVPNSFPIVAKNVRAWRIFRTNERNIMAIAAHAPRAGFLKGCGYRRGKSPGPASSGGVAGVDGQDGTRNITAPVAQQIFHHAGDIVRLR